MAWRFPARKVREAVARSLPDPGWAVPRLIQTSRLEAHLGATPDQRRAAFEVIKTAGLMEAMGLPASLTWLGFERPFRAAPAPVLYLLREREGGAAVGVVILWRPSSKEWPRIHYGLAPRFRGRGYGREGVGAVVLQLLRQGGIPGIGAFISRTNTASIRLARSLGMVPMSPGPVETLYGISPAQMKAPEAKEPKPSSPPALLRPAVYKLAAYSWALPYARRTLRFILLDLLPRI